MKFNSDKMAIEKYYTYDLLTYDPYRLDYKFYFASSRDAKYCDEHG